MTPETRTLSDRLLSTAMRRARQAVKTLPLLRRMAHGDIVVPEPVLNKVLAQAGLDEELPIHWETLSMHMYDGYFELDVQGAVKFIHGPTFRLQARFESVEITLSRQVVHVRLLREVQTFADGVVQRLLMIVVHAIFGRLLEAPSLLSMMDRGGEAFVQEEPDLIRIDLHRLRPFRRHFGRHVAGAAAAVLGKDTVLIHAIDCHKGELVIRTTTVAQELSERSVKLGAIAGEGLSKVAAVLQTAGKQVAKDVKSGIAKLDDALEPEPAKAEGEE